MHSLQSDHSTRSEVALLTPRTEFDPKLRCSLLKLNSLPKLRCYTPKTEHESLLDRVAASELTNTALISQLQDAVELLSVSVLHHRAAFDSLAERQRRNQDYSGMLSQAISLLAT